MARLPRIYIKGCSYHIVQRGNNREPCFYSEQDYATYLTFLKDSAETNGVEIHAYVLMTNHVHMLVTPTDKGDVSRMMQSLGRKYVRYFNAEVGNVTGRVVKITYYSYGSGLTDTCTITDLFSGKVLF